MGKYGLVEKVKVPGWEDVYYALLDSGRKSEGKRYEDWKEVRIDEHFSVKHRFWHCATMFYTDEYNTEVFGDDGAMCCEDEEEFAGECAGGLLAEFEKWYGRCVHPVESVEDVRCWAQAEPFVNELDRKETAVYENCCDYLYYGYGLGSLMKQGHHYDLPEERAREIWRLAFWYMAEGCMEDE